MSRHQATATDDGTTPATGVTVIRYERELGFRGGGWTTNAVFAQTFFQVPPRDALPRCDVLSCLQVAERPPGHYAWPFSTLVIDLAATESSILGAMKAETRRQIRQMERNDSCVADVLTDPSAATIDEFCAFYAKFSRVKGVGNLQAGEMHALARQQRLVLGRVRDHEDQALVWHAYYLGETRVTQLCSASQFRSAATPSERATVGKANRWLHWREILHFRQAELELFDLGGWYEGSEDADLLRINQFKKEFGGRILREWNSRLGCSAKGKLLVAVQRWRHRREKEREPGTG